MTDTPFDLLIRHGHIMDPGAGLDGIMDVGIRGAKIADVGPDLDARGARRTIDAQGLLVVPGLIDLHVHVHLGVSHYAVDPDLGCLARGVTTAVEAGSAGAHTYPSLKRFVIDRCLTRIIPLLNIAWVGMVGDQIGELEDMRFIDRDLAIEVGSRPEILGFKARMDRVGPLPCIEPLALGVEIARSVGKPIMVHIGRGSRMRSSLAEILSLLGPGDMITHTYHGHPGGILDDETRTLRPEVLDARERGILFDVGHGGGSYTFDVCKAALDQGFAPDVISSDLHTTSVAGPVFDLVTTMTKFWYLGMSLSDVVEQVTSRPAAILGRSDLGTLRPGSVADVSLLRIVEAEKRLTDCAHHQETAQRFLAPELTVKDGLVAAMNPLV